MAGGGIGEKRDDGGGCSWLKVRHRVVPMPKELDLLFSRYVLFQTYLLKAVTGLGYLALTWCTVVLLGGFISALGKKDFWCLTIISMMQAARIFHDLADQLLPNFFNLVTSIIRHNANVLRHQMWRVTDEACNEAPLRHKVIAKYTLRVSSILIVGMVVFPFLVLCYIPAFLYVYGGPVACFALALWRMVQHDYGSSDGHDDNNNKANLAPALDMFYSLVLLQGGLYLLWLCHGSWWVDHLITLRRVCKLPNTRWCRLSLVEFLIDTQAKCWRDLASIRGRKLVDYAAGLLDSGAWEDNLSGARLLDEFMRQGSDVRPLLLPCRHRIRKLIDALGWIHYGRDLDTKEEMREPAARLVAHIAGDLHLSQFPGAIHSISSLLLEDGTTLAYSNQQERPYPQEKQAMILQLKKKEEEMEARSQKKKMKTQDGAGHQQQLPQPQQQQQKKKQQVARGSTFNELILQGLVILERLASRHHNCRDICNTPGLLPKLTEPLYSATLVDEIKIDGWANVDDIKIHDWAYVVHGSLKVLNQLIRAPGESSRRLRQEISNKRAMSNLDGILNQTRNDKMGQDLKIQAMEIMTQLALDVFVNLSDKTKEALIHKLLQIFTADLRRSPGTVTWTAGRMLVLLTANSKTNSDHIRRLYDDIIPRLTNLLDGIKNTVAHLTDLLDVGEITDAKNRIVYTKIAVELLENLCTHYQDELSKNFVKETLLPKVLKETPSNRRQLPSSKPENENSGEEKGCSWAKVCSIFKKKGNDENQRKSSLKNDDEANHQNSAAGNDEENQQNYTLGNHEGTRCTSREGDDTEMKETSSTSDQDNSADEVNDEQTIIKELQEALLSLTLVIYVMLENQNDFNDAAEKEDLGGSAFVEKLKGIIEENCQSSAGSLRIVKLCGRIAESIMQRDNQYIEHFRNKEFLKSLSKASKKMSNLETCMLFAGTDFGRQRPLLFHLEKKVRQLVNPEPEECHQSS